MWFGTEDGLNKYDGQDFTIYKHVPKDSSSLSSSYINSIVENSDGYLYIGTKNGLNFYNPFKNKFTRLYLNSSKAGHDNVQTILPLTEQILLVGTANGLYKITNRKYVSKVPINNDQIDYSVLRIFRSAENIWLLYSNRLEQLSYADNQNFNLIKTYPLENSIKYSGMFKDDLFWLGTSKGLIKLNLKTQKTKTYKFYGATGSKDQRNNILAIANNGDNNLWVGTHGGGLINFNVLNESFTLTVHEPNDQFSLSSNAINVIYLDNTNILWIGTFVGGVNKYIPNQFRFKHYKQLEETSNSFTKNIVRSVLRDSDGDLWAGTHGGMLKLDKVNEATRVFLNDRNNEATISSNVIRALKEDASGNIWAGTWNNGLNVFNKQNQTFKRYEVISNDSVGPVRAIEIDKNSNIWFGGAGLWKFDPKTEKKQRYFNADMVPNLGIYSLYLDSLDNLWLGTYQNGLVKFNISDTSFKVYKNVTTDTTSLSYDHVTSITADSKGNIWLGTYGGGLNKLDQDRQNFTRYNTSNGLLNDVIYGVLADEKNNIWFSSNSGLHRLNTNTNQIKNFGLEYGIQNEEFNAGSVHKDSNGTFYFGGINGFNEFDPEHVERHKKVADIRFTSFKILNSDKQLESISILDNHISVASEAHLKYDQNTIELKFVELNFSGDNDNVFEYQLKGLSDSWNFLGNKKTIVLGDLDYKPYQLIVRSKDNPSKRARLNITISPPIWQSNVAYVLYILVLLAIGIFVWFKIRRQNDIRERFETQIKTLETIVEESERQKQAGNVNSITLRSSNDISAHKKFLNRTIEIVEAHLTDSNFNVEAFANEIFMSKSQLYRKLKKITGFSTTEFIRMVRLKKAAQMLKNEQGSVSEIAFRVGFDNVGYFSKCFKELFGIPPSQYIKHFSSSP